MRSIIINCPDCRKMLMKNTYLRPGSYLTIRCYYCGEIISVVSENGRLVIKNDDHKCEGDLHSEEDSGIINLSI
jgi:phage FluMu protein Com